MRRVMMSRLSWIYTVCKGVYFGLQGLKDWILIKQKSQFTKNLSYATPDQSWNILPLDICLAR